MTTNMFVGVMDEFIVVEHSRESKDVVERDVYKKLCRLYSNGKRSCMCTIMTKTIPTRIIVGFEWND